jgi:hypothetical protein
LGDGREWTYVKLVRRDFHTSLTDRPVTFHRSVVMQAYVSCRKLRSLRPSPRRKYGYLLYTL